MNRNDYYSRSNYYCSNGSSCILIARVWRRAGPAREDAPPPSTHLTGPGHHATSEISPPHLSQLEQRKSLNFLHLVASGNTPTSVPNNDRTGILFYLSTYARLLNTLPSTENTCLSDWMATPSVAVISVKSLTPIPTFHDSLNITLFVTWISHRCFPI